MNAQVYYTYIIFEITLFEMELLVLKWLFAY